MSRRHRVSVQVAYSGDGLVRRANLYDLGSEGVFISTPAPLPPGSDLDLTIYASDGFIHASGRVIWANLVETPGLPAGMGVRFVAIDPSARDLLSRQLDSLG